MSKVIFFTFLLLSCYVPSHLYASNNQLLGQEDGNEVWFDAVEYQPETVNTQDIIVVPEDGYASGYTSENDYDGGGYASDSSGYDSDDDDIISLKKRPKIKQSVLVREQQKVPSTSFDAPLIRDNDLYSVIDALGQKQRVMKQSPVKYGKTQENDRIEKDPLDDPEHLALIESIAQSQPTQHFMTSKKMAAKAKSDRAIEVDNYLRDLYIQDLDRKEQDRIEALRLRQEALDFRAEQEASALRAQQWEKAQLLKLQQAEDKKYLETLSSIVYPEYKDTKATVADVLVGKAKAVYSYFFGK